MTLVAGESAPSATQPAHWALLLGGLAAATAGGFTASLLATDREVLHAGACGVALTLLYGVVWPRVGNLDPTNSLTMTALPGSLLGALACHVASRPATQRFWDSTSKVATALPGRFRIAAALGLLLVVFVPAVQRSTAAMVAIGLCIVAVLYLDPVLWVVDKVATLLEDKARRRVPETHAPRQVRGDSPVRRALRAQRRVLVDGVIDDETANLAIAEMLFLDDQDPAAPLELLIDSPGGAFTASLAVADAMRELRCPVHTCCLGRAGGMAALLLAMGRRGERTIAERSEVVLTAPDLEHGPRNAAEREALGRAVAKCDQLLTQASGGRASLLRMREGPPPVRLSPQQAIRLGIVDRIRPAAEIPRLVDPTPVRSYRG